MSDVDSSNKNTTNGGDGRNPVEKIVGVFVYIKDSITERRLVDVVSDIEYSKSEVREIASETPHETVTPYHVAELLPYLGSDEEILAVLETQSELAGFEIEGKTGSEYKGGIMRASFNFDPFAPLNNDVTTNLLAVTDTHVIVLFTKMLDDDVHHIRYGEISDLEYKEGIPEVIIIQTTNKTYTLDVSKPRAERVPFVGRSKAEYRQDIQDIISIISERAGISQA